MENNVKNYGKKLWLTILFIALLWLTAFVFNHINAWAGFILLFLNLFWYGYFWYKNKLY